MTLQHFFITILICSSFFSCESPESLPAKSGDLSLPDTASVATLSDVARYFKQEYRNEADPDRYSHWMTGRQLHLKEPGLTVHLPSDNWGDPIIDTYLSEGAYVLVFQHKGRGLSDGHSGTPTISVLVEHQYPETDGVLYTATWMDRSDVGTITDLWTEQTKKIRLKQSVVIKTQSSQAPDETSTTYSIFWGNKGYGVRIVCEASDINWPSVEEDFKQLISLLTIEPGQMNRKREFGNLQSQAVNGDPDAQVKLGRAYLDRSFGPINVFRAKKWLMRAADQSHPQGQYYAAMLSLFGPSSCRNVKKGEALLEAAAENNHEDAQYQMGMMLKEESHLPDHLITAAEWLTRSARNHYTPALFALAELYEQGKGVEKDLEIAMVLYRDAADNGYAPAQLKMGQLYSSATQTTEYMALSKAYLFLAAGQGEAKALPQLKSLQLKMDEAAEILAQDQTKHMIQNFGICQFDCRPFHLSERDLFLKHLPN